MILLELQNAATLVNSLLDSVLTDIMLTALTTFILVIFWVLLLLCSSSALQTCRGNPYLSTKPSQKIQTMGKFDGDGAIHLIYVFLDSHTCTIHHVPSPGISGLVHGSEGTVPGQVSQGKQRIRKEAAKMTALRSEEEAAMTLGSSPEMVRKLP